MTDREIHERIKKLTRRFDILSLQKEITNREIERTKEAIS